MHAAFEAAWRDLGIGPARRIALPSWEAVKLTVARGGGVTGISRYAVTTELAAGSLAILRVSGWRVRRHFSIVHARDISLSPPAERFTSILREAVGKLVARSRRRPIARSAGRSAGSLPN
ncbi:MAG TPA: LysR substrate-binding domain-containing protein [Candidatus Limnocylindria bacterium]|nr:LysR substrate-binding domain-containing protein [Candidatus Limnocylindria bacterium]